MKIRRNSCNSIQKVSFHSSYKSPVEDASLLLPDYCLIFIQHHKPCWEHELELTLICLPFGTYHLIRQMGKKYPGVVSQSHLWIISWIAASRRMSHWQEDAACGVSSCAVQWVPATSAPSCYQDSSAACNTTASGLHSIWAFDSCGNLLVLGLCHSWFSFSFFLVLLMPPLPTLGELVWSRLS